MTDTPTKEELAIFTFTFEKYAQFDVQHRQIRGYSLHTKEEIEAIAPICTKVLAWLRSSPTLDEP
jgi:hypothetical protein